MARVKKGDTVAVLSGRDRGKRGKILRVLPKVGAALVEQVNLLKHFERRTRADQPGGVVAREAPIGLDRLALVCPRCGKPTRVGFTVATETKHRTCRRCRQAIDG